MEKVIELREIADKAQWERFFEDTERKTFLQSWCWGEFQQRMGYKIWRLGVFEKERLIGLALVVRIVARRGIFLLIQHGPVLAERGIFKIFMEELKKLGKQENASFIRVAPLLERNEENQYMFKELGFRDAPMHANAYEATWKLDIKSTQEQLLENMRKTTRYLIRKVEHNGDVDIEQSSRVQDVERYEHLNREVSKRQGFVPFSKEFLKNEFEVFARDGQALWFFGTYRKETAAAALVIFWSRIGFYHQAASLAPYAKFSIPYLLQWEAIKEAKRRRCTLYDFWGFVDPRKNPHHPWAGPTFFKMGFGGKAYLYMKTHDYPLGWRYWPIATFETVRKWRRKL